MRHLLPIRGNAISLAEFFRPLTEAEQFSQKLRLAESIAQAVSNDFRVGEMLEERVSEVHREALRTE
jgi:hypothetical protein